MSVSYATLICDIKRSQEMNDKKRAECQDKLYLIVDMMNKIYDDSLEQKLVFSAGDSIQGLFKECSSAFGCYLFIKYLFYPYEIRCGIGYGSINQFISQNKVNDFGSNFIDGESYHFARNAIDNAKKLDCDILIKTNKMFLDISVNQLMKNANLMERDLTEKQLDIFDAYNLISPINIYYNLYSDNYFDKVFKFLNNNIRTYKTPNDNYIINYLDLKTKMEKYLHKKLYINDIIDENGLILKDAIFDKDLSLFVGNLFNVSRENIRQISKSGKFDEIRKNHLAVYILFEKYFNHEVNL